MAKEGERTIFGRLRHHQPAQPEVFSFILKPCEMESFAVAGEEYTTAEAIQVLPLNYIRFLRAFNSCYQLFDGISGAVVTIEMFGHDIV